MPTSLKLPAELKGRVTAVIKGTGKSAHAFMVEAIAEQTRLAELRKQFVQDALEAEAEALESGTGHDASEVHAYLSARAAGHRPKRPKTRKWRR